MVEEQRSSDERVLGMRVRAIGGGRTLVAVLAAGSLFVAGCGDSSSSDASSAAATSAAVPTTPEPTVAADTAATRGKTTVVGLLTYKDSRFFMKPSTSANGADQVRGQAALRPDSVKKGLDIKITPDTRITTAKGAPLSLSKFKKQMAKAPNRVLVVRVKWTFKEPATSPDDLSGKEPAQIELFS